MRMEIKKDKFGKLSSDPIFKDRKIIFPSFTNPELAREGETWEAELIKEIPLNKVDKKGQPMFKGIFRLLDPIVYQIAIGSDGKIRIIGTNNSISVESIDEAKKIVRIRGREYYLPNLYIIHADPEPAPIEITEEELKTRLQWLTEDEIREAINSISFQEMKRYSGSSDECYDPFGRGGKFVANLRVKTLTWRGEENNSTLEEEKYYEITSNHPQIYTTSQFEDAINIEINKVIDKNEALTSFELKNYYELKTAIAPEDGKAVEYVLIKIKLTN
jgi:hypothetical protein